MANFRQNWQDLDFSRKLYTFGLIITFFSPFLPWFSDTNKFVSGSTYLGLTGPTAFLGLSIFVLASLSVTQELYFIVRGKLLLGPTVARWLYNGLGVTSLYLGGLSASVFLHPEVATNLLAKHLLWGFYVSIIGYIICLLGLGIELTDESRSAKSGRQATGLRNRFANHKSQGNRGDIADDLLTMPQDKLQSLTLEDIAGEAMLEAKNPVLKKQWQQQRSLENRLNTLDESGLF